MPDTFKIEINDEQRRLILEGFYSLTQHPPQPLPDEVKDLVKMFEALPFIKDTHEIIHGFCF